MMRLASAAIAPGIFPTIWVYNPSYTALIFYVVIKPMVA
jgi:hypothetical protein